MYICFSSVIQVCKPVSSCSHTGMHTCCSSFIHVCIPAFPHSYKYVCLLFLSHTCKCICFLSVIHVCIPAFPQSCKYKFLLFLSPTRLSMYICFSSVKQVCIPCSSLLFLIQTSMYAYSSWVIQVCTSLFLKSYKNVYLLLLSHLIKYTSSSMSHTVCIPAVPDS